MVRRRRLLLAAAATGTAGLAGCIDEFGTEGSTGDESGPDDGETEDDPDEGSPANESDGPDEESGGAVEHADADGLVESYRTERYRADVADGPTFEQFGSAEEAAEALALDERDDPVREALQGVLEATDFASEHLLAIEAQGPNLCHQLELETVSATEADGLTVEASVVNTSEEGEACAEAVAQLGLLARISYADDAEKPSEGSVSVSGGMGSAAGGGWASDSASASADRDVDGSADEE